MNRRHILVASAALAASAAVPVGIGAVASKPRAAASAMEAAEFVATIMALSPSKKAIFAALVRRNGTDAASAELADIVERLAVQGGWVRGSQVDALLEAFTPCS